MPPSPCMSSRDHVLERLERQVRVDRPGAVADEQRHVVHLAGVAGLDDEADHACAVLSRTRWWCTAAVSSSDGIGASIAVGVAVGQHDDPGAVGDRLADLARRPRRAPLAAPAPPPATRYRPGDHQRLQTRAVAVVVDVDDLGQLVVVDDRERQDELAAASRARVEQVRPPARSSTPTDGDDLLADGVERRVGDLREQLLEVVEQQPRPVGQHGDRRVGAHRADRPPRRSCAIGAMRNLSSSWRVAEHLLAAQHAVVAEHDVPRLGQVVEVDHARRGATRRTGARRRAST